MDELEDFSIGDVVEFLPDMETGEIVGVFPTVCTVEYFNKEGRLTVITVDKNKIFKQQ